MYDSSLRKLTIVCGVSCAHPAASQERDHEDYCIHSHNPSYLLEQNRNNIRREYRSHHVKLWSPILYPPPATMPWNNISPFTRRKSALVTDSKVQRRSGLPKEECSVCTFQNAPVAETCQWIGPGGVICGNPLTPLRITTACTTHIIRSGTTTHTSSNNRQERPCREARGK